ncbi:DnaT-like ssDNA-binding protein [Frigidibacter sp. MR17.24]|uniref:DnaT-like ssDNA-binding protein n=1 Tax=Frigidibacter sp. MR17.24 TaxID=3127345 RepID=UPI003012C3A2
MALSLIELAVTISEADAYASARGYASWTGTDEDKTAALFRGQSYIAGRFNGRWKTDFENDAAPDEVKFAIVEAAMRELVSPGSLLPDWSPAAQVKSQRRKVGPLERETEFATPTTASGARPSFGMIDALLSGMIGSTAGAANFAVTRG